MEYGLLMITVVVKLQPSSSFLSLATIEHKQFIWMLEIMHSLISKWFQADDSFRNETLVQFPAGEGFIQQGDTISGLHMLYA